MIKFFALILLFILMMLLISCSFAYEEFYYIEIEEKDSIKLVSFGKNSRPGMFDHEKMPAEYEIVTELYKLRLSLILDRLDAHMVVELVDNKNHLSLMPMKLLQSCGAFRKKPGTSDIIYIWGISTEDCIKIDRKHEREPAPKLKFKVLDKSGVVVGEEELGYTLRKNGWYIEFIGI